MKKGLVFFAMIILMTLFSVQAFASEYTLGDIDNDGSITASDARTALRASVNLEYLSSYKKGAADIDGDGVITASDARIILRVAVNLDKLERKPVHVYSSECNYSENEKVVKEATCTEEGKVEKFCACGKKKTYSIDKTEHVAGDEYVYSTEPTCERSGYGEKKCVVCNEAIPGTSTSIDKLGHLGDGEYCERCHELNPAYLPVFGLGETWVVSGNWEFTITDVKLHNRCNSFANGKGNYVVLVYYTYKNIGYRSSSGDGLFMFIDEIYDSDGNAGTTYPCMHETYHQRCIVGTKSSGSEAFLLQEYDGTITISMSEYDKDSKKHNAVFKIDMSEVAEPEPETPEPVTPSAESEALKKLCNGNTWKSEVGVNGTTVNVLYGWTLTFYEDSTAKLTTDTKTYNYTLDYIGQEEGCYVFDMNSYNSNVAIVYDHSAGELCLLINDSMAVFFY